jgi:hypothetical protein
MIFIYYIWVSTWWQLSVDLCKNRKGTKGETVHKTSQKIQRKQQGKQGKKEES